MDEKMKQYIKILLIASLLLFSISSVSAEDIIENTNEGDTKKLDTENLDVKAASSGVKDSVNLTADPIVLIYKDGTQLIAQLTYANGTPISNKTVNFLFTSSGSNYNKTTDANGFAYQNINLFPGEYDVVVTSYEDEQFFGKNISTTVEVLSTIIGKDLVKYYQDGSQFKATFIYANGTPITNKNVSFNINGVFYKRVTDKNGTATLNINLFPNNYTLTATNPNDDLQYSFNIEILPTIIATDVVKYHLNGTQFVAQVLDNQGKPVYNQLAKINIHGILYERWTDSKGFVPLNINLNPGDYILTIESGKYSKSVNITVLPRLISEKSFTFDFNASQKYSVKLVDEKGNPMANKNIALNINGVIYNRITDENGTAYLTINLYPGNYILTATHGNFSYSSTINVKKMSASLNVLETTVKSEDFLKVKATYKGTPISGLPVLVYYEEDPKQQWYLAHTSVEGIAQYQLSLPVGTYTFYTAIFDEPWYEDVMTVNSIKIV